MRASILLRISTLLFIASCLAPTDTEQPVGALSLSVVSGDGQTGAPGTELPNPLVARVEDSRGRGVKGQIVNFRVVSGGGSTFAGVAISGRDGLAQERWTLGFSGPQRVEARAVDPETGAALTFAVFTATLTDAQPPVVSNVTATPPNPTLGTPITLTALVSDASSGGSNITGASYTVDGGAASLMTADDGAFDETTEAVSATVNLTPDGNHDVCVRGSDVVGNVSAPSCIVVVVATPDPAIYVSVAGNDFNDGSINNPVRTIATGLNRAVAAGKTRLNVGQGSYSETVALRSGISLYGGYNATNWTRDPGLFPSEIAPSSGAAIEGTSVNNVTVDGFVIRGADATAAHTSGYGVRLSSASNVTISHNAIIAGNGLAGAIGANGADGLAGGNGGAGGFGNGDGPPGLGGVAGQRTCNGSPLTGGAGGSGGGPGAFNGNSGAAGPGTGGGAGGFGGSGGGTGSPGGNGANGFFVGATGFAGGGGGAIGGVVAGEYQPASGSFGGLAFPGSAGGGGGGGGGQGALFVIDGGGNGGGGGGTGGCGGAAGLGGGGGGGSFGVLLFESTGIAITDNNIGTEGGGNGGRGGFGGSGGAGGLGGVGGDRDLSEVGRGGNGGNGAPGGQGGGGGGGGGGPSIGILRVGGSMSQSGNTFSLGPVGSGGLGTGLATSGAAGVSATVREM